jgi:2-polyprenyl-3-methyl-5-hydroxy-6-metoxy-1,4-benzoquinol methylase
MNCCQCQGIEDLFNEKTVSKELAQYREKGPDKTTRLMIDAIKAHAIRGYALLDIGGGVGGIQHQLLDAGVDSAVDVDASQAYLQAARKEAQRRGLSDRIHFQHGNFVDLAHTIPPAEIVTLDRVICCYPDMEMMVNLSAARAKKLYGLVYPRDTWWVRAGLAVMNIYFRLRKNPFRTFAHPTKRVEALINSHGLKRHFYHRTLVWQVVVYARD